MSDVYTFKKLSESELTEELGSSANVLVEDEGIIKRVPKEMVGGNGEPDMRIEFNYSRSHRLGSDITKDSFTITHGTIDSIFDIIDEGKIPHIEIAYKRGYKEGIYYCGCVTADVFRYYDTLYISFIVYNQDNSAPVSLRLSMDEEDGIYGLRMHKFTTTPEVIF